MCREPVQYDAEQLKRSVSVEEKPVSYTPTPDIVQWQKEMAVLLDNQRQKGGVIDLEAEKNKFLVTEVSILWIRDLF